MIIRLNGTDRILGAAGDDLAELARSWGQGVTSRSAESAAPGDGVRGVDPVALASLVVSLPSAALAVADLADRIEKRHRAKDLITKAQHLKASHVTATIDGHAGPVDLATLTPDQLLDLAIAAEAQAKPGQE